MTPKELERLEKQSIYAMRVSSDLKDQVINSYLSELTKAVKAQVKRKNLLILVIEGR